MAEATRTFTFVSDAESFSGTPASVDSTLSWDSSGNPGGSLKTVTVDRNSNDSNYWELSGITWEDLNVPAGATVTHVRLEDGEIKTDAWNTVDSVTHGAWEIRTSDGSTVIATIWTGRTVTSEDSGFVNLSAQSDQAVDSAYEASSTSIRIRLNNNIDLGNDKNATASLYDDQIQIVVTYTAAATPLSQDVADDLNNWNDNETHEGTDLLDVGYNFSISDSFVLSGTSLLEKDDSFSISDDFALVYERIYSFEGDLNSWDDANANELGEEQADLEQNLADNLNNFLSDLALSGTGDCVLSDSFTLTDARFLLFEYLLYFDDINILTDDFDFSGTGLLDVQDNNVLSDEISFFGENFLTLADANTITDTLAAFFEVVLTQDVADTNTISSALEIDLVAGVEEDQTYRNRINLGFWL